MKLIYNKQQKKVYYNCKKCSLRHTENIDALSLSCKSIKKEITKKHFDRSLLKWNNKYCSRCNCVILGINRGFCWYCNNCNTYLLDFLDRRSNQYHIT